MPSFAFVSDAGLREALLSDHREMERCYEVGAWKAVHVLAGSLVEAMLGDYLLSSGVGTAAKVFKWPLARLIDESAAAGALTKKTVDLSSAVKEYRNLIHPGRKIRLGETVDQNAATVVRALVDIISEEVARDKQLTYGYTAEQLLAKLESDRSVLSLLKHLASETKDAEVLRLLQDLIPQRLLETVERTDLDPAMASHLGSCHRQLVELTSDDIRTELADRFVEEIKEGSSYTIQVYLDYLVRASDLAFLKGRARSIAVDRLLVELKDKASTGVIPGCLHGLGEFIGKEQVEAFVDPLARAFFEGPAASVAARRFFEAEYGETQPDVDEKIAGRLEQWETTASKNPDPSILAALQQATRRFTQPDDDLPF